MSDLQAEIYKMILFSEPQVGNLQNFSKSLAGIKFFGHDGTLNKIFIFQDN